MSNIFVVHGVEGYQVIIPQFPTPENQTLEEWLKVFEQYKQYVTPDTIVVGHSLGVPFLLSIIEQTRVKVAFLVAGFVGKCDNQFDDVTKTFAQKPFDWKRIRDNCKDFTVFHADNDPYIRLEKAQELADLLRIDLTLIQGAGHFNIASGYKSFDLLLQKIKRSLR